MPRILIPFLVATVLAGCTADVQTTSGTDYLSRGPIADPAIREAAAIEPDLRLPARIGDA